MKNTAIMFLDKRKCDKSNGLYDLYVAWGKIMPFVFVSTEAGLFATWKKLFNVFRGEALVREETSGFYTLEYLCLFPLSHRFCFIQKWNLWLTSKVVSVFLKRKGSGRLALMLSRPEHQTWLNEFNEDLLIYSVHDSYVHYPSIWNGDRAGYLANEEKLMRKADAVVCVSKPLYERSVKFNSNTFYIPNGADYELFKDVDKLKAVKKQKRILVIGSLDERVNYEWLEACAKKFEDCELRIVGPLKSRDPEDLKILNRLKELPNVQVPGSVPFDTFPQELAGCDVGILPYKMNDWTAATSPLKFYQYLAAGKPIVSSPIPQVMEYEGVASAAASEEDFLKGVNAALYEDTKEKKEARLELAAKCTWKNRMALWLDVLEKINQNQGKKTMLLARTFRPVNGGIETFYHQLALGMGKRMVVLTEPRADSQDFDAKQPYQVLRRRLRIRIKFGLKVLNWLAARFERMMILRKVAGQLKAHKPETFIIGDGWLSWLIPHIKKQGVKTAVFLHGKELMRMMQFKAQREMNALPGADVIYVNSRFTRRLAEDCGVLGSKIRILSPGVDARVLRPGANGNFFHKQLGVKDRKVLLTLSRLAERKGIDKVIEVLPEIIREVPNVLYVVAGDGPMKERLKAKTEELRMGNYVKFVGRITDEEKIHYLNAADVFVLPNLLLKDSGDAEGFGIVFLEANACGKPVIGGRNGGTEDAVVTGETGILLDPENKDELKNAIVRLIADEGARKRMGEAGRKRVEQEFDWPIIQERFRQWIEK